MKNQEMMIDNNVEGEIVDHWVNVTNEKMENYHELIDRLKGCLEHLHEKKEPETREEEDKAQEKKFQKKKRRKAEDQRNQAGDKENERG